MKNLSLLLATILASSVHARTDLAGCTSSATFNQWHEASRIWYVPETGEICDIPDCGGGRAPPKLNNPACPGLYTGTATYEPSYLPGYGPGATASTSTIPATASATVESTTDLVSSSSTGTAATIRASVATSSSGGSVSPTPTPTPTSSTSASTKSTGTPSSSNLASGVSDVADATSTPNAANMVLRDRSGVMGVAAVIVGFAISNV